jgi:hypothetical protein
MGRTIAMNRSPRKETFEQIIAMADQAMEADANV